MKHVIEIYRPEPQTQTSAPARALIRVGELIGAPLLGPLDEVQLIHDGIPPVALDRLKQLGLPPSEQHWIIKPRTLAHRKSNQESLTQDETGRWLRAAKIMALAIEVFGDKEKALRWLGKARAEFGNRSAMAILSSEPGALLVEETLNQIDSGYFA